MKRFLILVMFACVGLMGAAQHVIVDGGSPNSPFPAATTTSTPTNTPTATPTSTNFVFVSNSAVTYNGPYANGFGPTFTPTNTFTPVPGVDSRLIPSCVLSGKSLSAGLAEATTISSNVATITHTSHGYAAGDIIVMTGTPTGGGTFNLLYVIQSATTNTYTINTSGLSNGPVTTATEMYWFSGTRSFAPTLIKNITRNSAGDYTCTFTNTQTDSFYRALGSAGSTTNQTFFSISTITPQSTTVCRVIFETNSGTFADANNSMSLEFLGIQ